jgi:hypothetical protein
MMRPYLWLLIGFVFAPALYFALGIVSLGSAHPILFPVVIVAKACLGLFAVDSAWMMFRRLIVTSTPQKPLERDQEEDRDAREQRIRMRFAGEHEDRSIRQN